jgi:hypothetical protein
MDVAWDPVRRRHPVAAGDRLRPEFRLCMGLFSQPSAARRPHPVGLPGETPRQSQVAKIFFFS